MTQKTKKVQAKTAKREKGSCGRVHAWACAVSASRSLELLPRKIALKFNFRRLKSYRAIVVLNTAPPPPPAPLGREGYPLMWTILGCAAGQDTVFGPCRVWSVPIDIPFRFSVLNMVRVSNPPSLPCTQTLIKSPPSYSPPPREWRDSAEPRLRDAECHEVSVAKITEHSNSQNKMQ